MPTFESFDGTKLWFDDQVGDGEDVRGAPVVVALHGFAADSNINFVRPGVFDALLEAGYRVVVTDFRGHGLSAKPRDAAAYADNAIRRDVQSLLDHLGIERVAVVGYSMGSGIAVQLAAHDPRVQRVVMVGAGDKWLERNAGDGADMISALLADDPESVDDPHTRRFRGLVDSVRADRLALAAMVSERVRVGPHLDSITVPVLVATGLDDDVAGDPAAVADRIPGARTVRVPGNHFNANAEPAMHRAILDFLGEPDPSV